MTDLRAGSNHEEFSPPCPETGINSNAGCWKFDSPNGFSRESVMNKTVIAVFALGAVALASPASAEKLKATLDG